MAGLRERKKEQTRRRIAGTALRMFAARGYDAVTVNEIAAAADVAKATLFAYFPTKESLVLSGVAEDDLAGVVTGRPAGQAPLDALRAYARGLAAGPVDADVSGLVTTIRVIADSPALRAGAGGRQDRQRHALAQALAAEYPETEAALMAAQITASMLTLQEAFFGRLAAGAPLADASRQLAADVEVAFELLEHGLARAR